MKIYNPATETLIREVAEDNAASVAQKFEDAHDAQGEWADTPLPKRIAAVKRFADLVAERKEDLAKTLTSETAKPIAQSRNELAALAGRIGFFLDHVADVTQTHPVFSDGGMTEEISYEPLGVIGNISAWNYPYFVGSNVFVPALLTGNAVLYKPSEFSTLTGIAIGEIMHKAGVPKDVFSVVVGTGEVGAALLAQKLNGIFFTGSYATGRKIAEAAAPSMMKVQLELGGKDPTYVCEDVDVAKAAESLADGAFYNNGQSCCSVERIYVHEKIYTAFLDAFLAQVKNFIIGDPLEDKTYISSLTRKAQLAVLERQVADAVKKGAKLLCGGKRIARAGAYFEPTVLANVDHTMEIMQEESFGPIIGIQEVSTDVEALVLMNDNDYGLTAGVYTKDHARAQTIMRKLNAGSVYLNCCDRVSPRLPWSGRGQSGMGSTLGEIGIQAFVQPKAWHLRS